MPASRIRPRVLRGAGVLALALIGFARPATAQLPSASGAALGVGDNYTARARGYHAVAWNPAALGLPGNPRFSLTVLPLRGIAGLDPITLSDLKDYEDETVPADVRAAWLQRITDEGRQKGSVGADVTVLALNIGRFGFQVSSTVRGTVDVAPDGAEALLFGNAGRTGEPRDLGLGGSTLEGTATSTLAVAIGIPLGTRADAPDQSFAIGATVKYILGHFVAKGRDRGSAMTSDPLRVQVDFPVVHTDPDEGGTSGSGIALDVGAVWRQRNLTVAGTLRNVINTFEWDEAKLVFRPGTALFDRDESSSDFEERPYAEAPAELRDAVADLNYSPALALGVALQAASTVTLSADFRQQFGDGILLEPKTHVGAGLEFRPVPILPLRAGVAAVTGGVLLSGGLGLEFGAVNLTAAGASRSSDLGTDAIAMVGVSFGAR